MCGTDHLHQLIKLNFRNVYKSALPPAAFLSSLHLLGKQSCWVCFFILGLSVEHRLECKHVFKISAPLPGQHFDSNVYDSTWLQILTTNSRAKVNQMLIGCSQLLGRTGICCPCSCPAFKPLQWMAGTRGLLTYLEGAFIGKKPKTPF